MGERLNLQRCQSIITRPRGWRLCRRERERVLEREGEREKKVRAATVTAIQIENYIIVEINHDPLIMVFVSTYACRFKYFCFSLLLSLSLCGNPSFLSNTHMSPQSPLVYKWHNSHILISAATAGTWVCFFLTYFALYLGLGLGLGGLRLRGDQLIWGRQDCAWFEWRNVRQKVRERNQDESLWEGLGLRV